MSEPKKPQRKILGQEDVQRWLFAFQKAICAENQEELEKLFHANTIGFETGKRSASSSDEVVKDHWKELCPNQQHSFAFLMADARVIPAPGMFVVCIKHMTTRKIAGCEPFFGQMTFVLCNFEGKLLCVHSHESYSV